MARRLIKDVLSVTELTKLRREGLGYGEIGDRFGFSLQSVAAYGKKVLPPELQGHLGVSKVEDNGAKKPAGCVRCGADEKVDPESGLCLTCQRELAHGGDLLEDPGRIRAKVRATAALAKRKAAKTKMATQPASPEASGVTSREPVETEVVPTGGQASTMDVTSKLPEPVCGLQEGTPAEDGIPIGGVRWNGWTPEALESLRADVDQQELERLELLAKVKEQQEETAYWCEQAVKLAIRLVDLQTERAADMERWAQQLEEIGMLLSRAGFAVREERRPLVLEPDLLEEAVNGLTGERLLIARDVVW